MRILDALIASISDLKLYFSMAEVLKLCRRISRLSRMAPTSFFVATSARCSSTHFLSAGVSMLASVARDPLSTDGVTQEARGTGRSGSGCGVEQAAHSKGVRGVVVAS